MSAIFRILLATFILVAPVTNSFADSLKIGVMAPLTGPLAEYGVATKNGIELAVKEKPDQFNNIQFVFEDTRYEAKQSVLIYNKLRENTDIKMIFSWGSNPSIPIIPLAEKDCFPLVTMDFSLSEPIQRKCVTGFVNSTLEIGKVLANHLTKSKYKNLAVVKVENAYINGMLDGVKAAIGPETNIEVIATFEPGDNDFRSIITRLKTKKTDALGIFLYAGQIATFYQQMKNLNFKIDTFGTDFFESREEIKRAGDSMLGAVYAHLNADADFVKRYTAIYGTDSQIASAGSGYDFALLVAHVYSQLDNSSDLVNAFRNSGPQSGVMGNYHFVDLPVDGPRFRFPIYLKQIKDGGFVVLEQ